MKTFFGISILAWFALASRACIWDADSLWHEKLRSRDLATAILGEPSAAEDTNKLSARIKELEAHRSETNADWWNNLAGAYLRLNQPAAAAKLLEPVVEKFPNDYGIHANLGTAYHLLGRYAEAEKEIARDLEINPAAHFGLEKYHLALLQYLVRDAKYQSRHVYVDEFTGSLLFRDGRFYFIGGDWASPVPTNELQDFEVDFEEWSKTGTNNDQAAELLNHIAASDPKPNYRAKWDLAKDTNLTAGVIYMAQMNPKEPACFTMLGVAAWQQRDYHLAVSAFEKSLALGSPQTFLLKQKIFQLNHYIDGSAKQSFFNPLNPALPCIAAVVLLYFFLKIRGRRRKQATIK